MIEFGGEAVRDPARLGFDTARLARLKPCRIEAEGRGITERFTAKINHCASVLFLNFVLSSQ